MRALNRSEVRRLVEKLASEARRCDLRESLGAAADEEALYDAGWYPLDDRMMTWAHPDVTEGEPIGRVEALRAVRKDFDWKSGGEWSDVT